MNRAEEMRKLFGRWRSSGLSLLAFGKQEGVAYSRLLYWRRKLGDDIARRKRTAAPAPPELGPVRIVPEESATDTLPEPFDVWLANGISLQVTLGFDERELRRLVVVLATC